jgi:DNA-directed RNA polymerase subunit L
MALYNGIDHTLFNLTLERVTRKLTVDVHTAHYNVNHLS